MSDLVPYPFGALVTRALTELERCDAVFDLPTSKLVRSGGGRDLSVALHGHAAATPLGPAAGPHCQLAQNVVLAFLTGGRIFELKTVQILDELEIPRPCIDMETVGYNVEWSQELKLEESLEEYVKASMLIEILVASGHLELEPGFDRRIFDMSVGYDLAGVKTERVQRFLRSMLDAEAVVERLRPQIPDAFAAYRDLDFQTHIADTLTLSTFHGCPPDEIEGILRFLLEEVGLHCIVKLNPTLLGPAPLGEILHDQLGYRDLVVPDAAFDKDTSWSQAVDFVGRLGDLADRLGRSFGAKFTNTLIVENHREFFPASEREMYLSGPPLHVLAMNLVGRFRETFGDRFPLSFSAGIDRKNFADAAALGLTPITVCTDLLKPGGYARASKYFTEIDRRMGAVGADTLGDFTLRAFGRGAAALDRLGLDAHARARCAGLLDGEGAIGAALAADAAGDALYTRWVSAARLDNTAAYLEALAGAAGKRYAQARNAKPPRKIGSHLALFDCVTCDKCLPVCPNAANFAIPLAPTEVDVVHLTPRADGAGFDARSDGRRLALGQAHQIGNFVDFCNECGNCDVFCPEDGGPYVVKPRFFGSLDGFTADPGPSGFHIERRGAATIVHGRFDGDVYRVAIEPGEPVRYRGPTFSLTFSPLDPAGTATGDARGDVDLTYYHIMDWLQGAVLAPDAVNFVSTLVSGVWNTASSRP